MGGHLDRAGDVTVTSTEHGRAGQRGKPGRHVDDRAAGEIEDAPLPEKAIGVPRPVRQRRIYEDAEQTDEHQVAVNRIRSAKAPLISAGVMIANLSWKSAKSRSGIVGDRRGSGASVTPRNNTKLNGLPTTPPRLSPNARLKPTTIQMTLTTPRAMKHCNMVEMTFFGETIPP